MQRNGDQLGLLEPGGDIQEVERPPEDRDILLDAKDQTIAELKEQVAFLRRELERKDEIMLRMAGSELPAGYQNGDRTSPAREGREETARPALPDGYRVVAFASDAWVLIAPRGLRVAAYRGELDLCKVALDAREHHHNGDLPSEK